MRARVCGGRLKMAALGVTHQLGQTVWMSPPRSFPLAFTHYTKTQNRLLGILQNGFGLRAPRQHVIRELLPHAGFDKHAREPEQFGRVSFTEASVEEAASIRGRFGSYGVVVTPEWAARRGILPVAYVVKGSPAFFALRTLFEAGYREIQARIAEDRVGFPIRGLRSADAAAISGAPLWAGLCKAYRTLEWDRYAFQREWRICSPFPILSPEKRADAMAAVNPPTGWLNADGIGTFHFKREDVLALVVPRTMAASVRALLPAEYQDAAVIETAI